MKITKTKNIVLENTLDRQTEQDCTLVSGYFTWCSIRQMKFEAPSPITPSEGVGAAKHRAVTEPMGTTGEFPSMAAGHMIRFLQVILNNVCQLHSLAVSQTPLRILPLPTPNPDQQA